MTQKDDLSVTVIIPAYNEAAVIGSVVSGVRALHPGFEVLVVDDSSTDDTARLAAEAGARVVRHPYNRGNGAAIKTGIRSARGRILVMMDGDGQHDPAEISLLLDHVERYEMVVGARDFKTQGAFHRSLANRIYSGFATYLAEHQVADLTSGFRAIHRRLAIRFAYLLPNTFSYPSTITLALFKAGYGVKYVPIHARRRVGRSKIRILRDGFRFFAILVKLVSLFNPMKVFFPLAMAFFAPGLTYTVVRLAQGHRLSNPMVLSLSVSAILFALGLISEQIALLRLEHIDEILYEEPPPGSGPDAKPS
jgi:glycosyltransferase involved in cell wall biosynthesis